MKYRILNWDCTNEKPVSEAYTSAEVLDGMWFVDIDDMQKFLDDHKEIGSVMINRPALGDIGCYRLWITKGARFGQRG